MFDDDVCFGPTNYRGVQLVCEGGRILRQALAACYQSKAVVGCDYSGRQDLSIIEHACARNRGGETMGLLQPSISRERIANVAPGGISTAFLVVGGSASQLPDFVEHYNEDYMWLHKLACEGWRLLRVNELLIHAPPGDVSVTAEALAFQIFGEIVWLSVLERERYPANQSASIEAGIDEIMGDITSALTLQAVHGDPATLDVLQSVRGDFQRARDEPDNQLRMALRAAITQGLSYCYGELQPG